MNFFESLWAVLLTLVQLGGVVAIFFASVWIAVGTSQMLTPLMGGIVSAAAVVLVLAIGLAVAYQWIARWA